MAHMDPQGMMWFRASGQMLGAAVIKGWSLLMILRQSALGFRVEGQSCTGVGSRNQGSLSGNPTSQD